MKRILFMLVLLTAFLVGCGPIEVKQTMNNGRPGPTPVSMPPLTYIVPLDDGIVHPQQGLIEDLMFRPRIGQGYEITKSGTGLLGPMTSTRAWDVIDSVFAQLAYPNSLIVERKLTNRTSAILTAGKRYYVNYTTTKNATEYRVNLQPVKSETYQAKAFMPPPVPEFTETDLSQYLLATRVYYRFEVDSEFNSESVYSNFVRQLKVRDFGSGETDPVTGKIFKQQFVFLYRNQEVFFTLETFPYRNGSKAVMYLRVPAMLTSANTVDYRIILDEIKANLKKIVKS